MASSLSNFVNNLFDKIYKFKSKYRHEDEKCEICGIKYKYCDCFLENSNFKDDLIEYKCLCYNKNYQHKIDQNLRELFFNTNKCSKKDNNKFTLLLRKGIYPYEYMDDWERFNETSLS